MKPERKSPASVTQGSEPPKSLAARRAEAGARNRTPSGRPIGKLPYDLPEGGLDALVWPWFRRWIENPHNRSCAEWPAIKDKRRFLVWLVISAISKGPEARSFFLKAEAIAPALARRALPLLRRRISKITLDDYLAVTRNPSSDGECFPPRSYDKRAKLRAGLTSLPKFLGVP